MQKVINCYLVFLIVIISVTLSFVSFANDTLYLGSSVWNGTNDTVVIQHALDSGVRKIIIGKTPSPWVTLSVTGHCSNVEIVFEEGTEILAKRGVFLGIRDSLFTLCDVTNVIVRGTGHYGGTLRMWKSDYQKSPYLTSEWRHALQLRGVRGVLVENMNFIASGGDGIMIGRCANSSLGLEYRSENVTIRDCVCDDNNRQGISVISVKDLLIERCILKNTFGMPPQSGIDFEPDQAYECISGCIMRDCVSENNAGCGYEFYLGQLNSSSKVVSVKIENCISRGNVHSVLLSSRRTDYNFVKGMMEFSKCLFADAKSSAIHAYSKEQETYHVVFRDCTITNSCMENGSADVVCKSDSWRENPPDGFEFLGTRIFQDKSKTWFIYESPSMSPKQVVDFKGEVLVVDSMGVVSNIHLNSTWRKVNFKPLNLRTIPSFMPVGTIDGQRAKSCGIPAGDLLPLSEVETFRRVSYLFHIDKPMEVRFIGYQLGKPIIGDFLVTSPGGTRYAKIKIPGNEPKEFSVTLPEAGCFRLYTHNPAVRFVLEKSSVPVALDLRERPAYLRSVADKPILLWVFPQAKSEYVIASFWSNLGKWNLRFGNDLINGGLKTNPSGKINGEMISLPVNDNFYRIDVAGVPAVIFLSSTRYFR